MTQRLVFIGSTLLALCLLSVPAIAEKDEVWWDSALNEANRDGYRLIDTESLSDLMARSEPMVILDARADYEFEAGHIPGSVNLEFDLGDRIDLSSDKRHAFQNVVGTDRQQLLVIYCRSFR